MERAHRGVGAMSWELWRFKAWAASSSQPTLLAAYSWAPPQLRRASIVQHTQLHTLGCQGD